MAKSKSGVQAVTQMRPCEDLRLIFLVCGCPVSCLAVADCNASLSMLARFRHSRDPEQVPRSSAGLTLVPP